MKIKLLLPYYGKWPNYFDIFLEGCRKVKFIDFHFFCDSQPPSNCSSNITFTNIPFEDLISLFCRKTGAQVPRISPYKLCDFKPTYGQVFSEYLVGYNFWGYGDIDVIYGNISDFITNDLLSRYDVISCRRDWISGSFALFRNESYLNNLYKRSPSHKMILESEKYYGFDEVCGINHGAIMRGADILELDKVGSMTYIVKYACQSGEIKAFFKNMIAEYIEPGHYIVWDDGRVISRDGEEYLLFNYVCNKNINGFHFPAWKSIPKKIHITSTGFYTKGEFASPVYPFLVFWRKLSGFKRYLERRFKRLIGRI